MTPEQRHELAEDLRREHRSLNFSSSGDPQIVFARIILPKIAANLENDPDYMTMALIKGTEMFCETAPYPSDLARAMRVLDRIKEAIRKNHARPNHD